MLSAHTSCRGLASLSVLFAALGLATAATRAQDPPAPKPVATDRADVEVRAAFAELVAATHWRQRNAARDELARHGDKALPVVLRGSGHEQVEVRRSCHEILREHFAVDDRAVDAIVRALQHDDDAAIRYASAFHLGAHRIARAVPALRAVAADPDTDARTRAGAYKSLGELGTMDVTVPLWQGLGSDDPYTRYLSNLGIKGLTGKDLTDFGYEGPWEGAFVSGPAVGRVRGQPIEKAQKRVRRWQAIVAFSEWLKADKPKLFHELEQKLW